MDNLRRHPNRCFAILTQSGRAVLGAQLQADLGA
jgi:hypothetical protein